ncbi:hypothetical protein [Flavobacterium]|jgi:hypothetical protein|uniref:DUF4235 domain-containing protein n=1 Tax=Flavobacterium piscis TaxID=1114874 RepID=A0ABX2XKL4_9FLAO|nr:hypothetical protein [Flavobacterium]MCD9573950.1 hypothetical protein [Flavobacterium soyae]OCB73833.1 hypothetical protein FLP_14270 [Flavobacterium piscis]OXE95790.1 hypothetical protein B0A79_24045 [Flavobacterium piscis]TDP02995.1 hypothetical protein EV145_102155 [Flavobacterium sp. 245]
MGFFKKIGTAIKKNVSFKNLVKVATPIMGAIPFVGGAVQNISQNLQDAHEAKKANNAAQAEYNNQQALAVASQTAGAVANAGSQIFAKAVTTGINDGLSTGFVQGSGQVGATVVSSTIKVWFQRNWKIVLGAVAGLIALIWFLRRDRNNSGRRVARKR